MKNRKKEREELGVILYGIQQQLAQLQMDLEKNHNCHTQISMARRQLEEELLDLRSMYKKTCQSTEDERKKGDVYLLLDVPCPLHIVKVNMANVCKTVQEKWSVVLPVNGAGYENSTHLAHFPLIVL